jgi:hypothetical protein
MQIMTVILLTIVSCEPGTMAMSENKRIKNVPFLRDLIIFAEYASAAWQVERIEARWVAAAGN